MNVVKLPLCCSPRAYKLLNEQLPSLSSLDSLIRASVAVAMHQMDEVDPADVDATLQKYADTVRSRVRGRQTQAILAHLHEFLFDELSFIGNASDYYNTSNSYLPAVLETKRGLPITLSLIYTSVAQKLGLKAYGVALPGHFMVGIDIGDEKMLIDPFAGGKLVTTDEAHTRLKELFGPEVEWSDELLQPATHVHWLTRMLQNLLNVFSSTGHYADVAAMLEMEMTLWPQQHQLQRDLALVLARCGLSQPASVWLDHYLKTNPDDPQRSQLQQLLDVLSA
jgi:regulator of sirC expression with transglutaminase-like and TPR domain